MAVYEYMKCKLCKYYEYGHKFPNPNATATHWCKRCCESITYVKDSPFSDYYFVWLPKGCYFNNYFEESEAAKKEREARYDYNNDFDSGLACQVED